MSRSRYLELAGNLGSAATKPALSWGGVGNRTQDVTFHPLSINDVKLDELNLY